ncbi:LytR/AlgR family response regulator transcription factor [Aquimarina rhabdastrellae]
MITYLIIDDEHIAHDIIKGYADLLLNLKLEKHCYDAIEAIEYLNNHTVDLIFLDLNMPKLKGFDFLKSLSSPPKIIVTTAYKEHALEGYELNVIDYLLKPFSFERFVKAVNKLSNVSEKTTSIISNEVTPDQKTIFIYTNKKYIQITLDALLYIEAAGNYVKIFMDDQTITIREKISDILSVLDSSDLIQVHKSFAVSKKHINSIEGNRIYINGSVIPIGKTYKMHLIQLLK